MSAGCLTATPSGTRPGCSDSAGQRPRRRACIHRLPGLALCARIDYQRGDEHQHEGGDDDDCQGPSYLRHVPTSSRVAVPQSGRHPILLRAGTRSRRQNPGMLDVSAAGWAVTIGVIGGLLAGDIAFSARRPHTVGFREAVAWSVFYVVAALAFGVVFGVVAGWEFGAQYFAGYVVEKSLSVDNLFVFVIIMGTFAVPPEHQQRVLTIGIAAALVLRACFIAVGAALLDAFSIMLVVFGIILVGTGSSSSATATKIHPWTTTCSSSPPGASYRSPTATTAATW